MTRTLTRELVAWCPECLWYLPVDEAGTPCPGDEHETLTGKRNLLKRQRWVCENCGGSFRRHEDAVEHSCEF